MRRHGLALGVAFIYLHTAACGLGCDNRILKSVPGPGGRLKAVVFVRNCGATTWYLTGMSILDVDEPLPRGEGNVLTIDDNNGQTKGVLGGDGAVPLMVVWNSDYSLSVQYPAVANVLAKSLKRKNVVITFVPK